MEGISDIKISGIDERRPPKIMHGPYIDLFFKLSHKAPADWCTDFNAMLSRHPSKPKIKANEGLFIEAWVREPEDVVSMLTLLKEKVAECSHSYIERIENATRTADNEATQAEETGEQGNLNRIIASLDFD